MLDNKRVKGTIKLGGNGTVGTIMTHKQGSFINCLTYNTFNK